MMKHDAASATTDHMARLLPPAGDDRMPVRGALMNEQAMLHARHRAQA